MHLLTRLVVLFAPLFALASLQGQVYQQSFSSPVEGLPSDWGRATPGNFSTNGIAEISTAFSTNWLHQRRVEGSAGNSFVYFQGDFGDTEGGVLEDFSVSAVMRHSQQSA